MSITVTLPTPPPANKIWRPGKRRDGKPAFFARQPYVDWQRAAGWEVKVQAKGARITGRYTCEITVPMRGDVDGRTKAILDLLASIGLTPDDKHCVSVTARKEPGRKDCLVVIAEASS